MLQAKGCQKLCSRSPVHDLRFEGKEPNRRYRHAPAGKGIILLPFMGAGSTIATVVGRRSATAASGLNAIRFILRWRKTVSSPLPS
jgi:hypothetical protein